MAKRKNYKNVIINNEQIRNEKLKNKTISSKNDDIHTKIKIIRNK